MNFPMQINFSRSQVASQPVYQQHIGNTKHTGNVSKTNQVSNSREDLEEHGNTNTKAMNGVTTENRHRGNSNFYNPPSRDMNSQNHINQHQNNSVIVREKVRSKGESLRTSTEFVNISPKTIENTSSTSNDGFVANNEMQHKGRDKNNKKSAALNHSDSFRTDYALRASDDFANHREVQHSFASSENVQNMYAVQEENVYSNNCYRESFDGEKGRGKNYEMNEHEGEFLRMKGMQYSKDNPNKDGGPPVTTWQRSGYQRASGMVVDID